MDKEAWRAKDGGGKAGHGMMMQRRVAILLLLLGCNASIAKVTAQAEGKTPATSQLDVTLRPTLGSDGKVAAMDVALDLRGIRLEPGQSFSLRIPVEFAGVKHVADRIENLEVRSHGALILSLIHI